MKNFLCYLLTWLNVPANWAGRLLLGFVAMVPGWLSSTIIAAVSGLVLLIIFKHTSNQTAIARTRDKISAELLALKLFKDSLSVTFQSEARLFKEALRLLIYSLVPLAVMLVPVSLLLAQMGLWYQWRPLRPGEQTLVTVSLSGSGRQNPSPVQIESSEAASVVAGPVQIISKRQVLWKIRADQPGRHRIVFETAGERIEKDLCIGNGFMRISAKRPGRQPADILLHCAEKPFGPDSIVKSVSIDYPQRQSFTSGSDWWLVYFFVASMVFALLFKPLVKVRI